MEECISKGKSIHSQTLSGGKITNPALKFLCDEKTFFFFSPPQGDLYLQNMMVLLWLINFISTEERNSVSLNLKHVGFFLNANFKTRPCMTPNLEAQKVSRIDFDFHPENSNKDLNYIVTLKISKLVQLYSHWFIYSLLCQHAYFSLKPVAFKCFG